MGGQWREGERQGVKYPYALTYVSWNLLTLKIESKSIKANSKLKATKKEHVNDKIILKD